MADGVIELEVKLNAVNLDSFSDRIAASVAGKLGKVKSSDKIGKQTQEGTRKGVVQGGLQLGVLGVIANSVKDIPIVVAVMKLFKVILMLLFLPLIPVLKPVLTKLADMAKQFAKDYRAMSPQQQAMTGSIEASAFVAAYAATGNLGESAAAATASVLAYNEGVKTSNTLLDIANRITGKANATTPAFIESIATAGMSLDAAKANVSDFSGQMSIGKDGQVRFGAAVDDSTTALTTFWNNVKNGLGKVAPGTDFSGFGGASTAAANTIATKIAKQAQQVIADVPKIIDAFLSAGAAGQVTYSANDAIVTPNGVINTHPDDYIIATKNPGSLGGGTNITITVDHPTVSNQQDIKTLVKAISLEMQKQVKRVNSYV